MGKGKQKQIHTMIRRSVAPHLRYTIKINIDLTNIVHKAIIKADKYTTNCK